RPFGLCRRTHRTWVRSRDLQRASRWRNLGSPAWFRRLRLRSRVLLSSTEEVICRDFSVRKKSAQSPRQGVSEIAPFCGGHLNPAMAVRPCDILPCHALEETKNKEESF